MYDRKHLLVYRVYYLPALPGKLNGNIRGRDSSGSLCHLVEAVAYETSDPKTAVHV